MMRYSDQPTVEVTQRVKCDPSTAWTLVTDIGLPARCSPELQSVEWLGGADGVRVGGWPSGGRTCRSTWTVCATSSTVDVDTVACPDMR